MVKKTLTENRSKKLTRRLTSPATRTIDGVEAIGEFRPCAAKLPHASAHLSTDTGCRSEFPSGGGQRAVARFAALLLVFLTGFTAPAGAAEDIFPPFGFRWNDASARVERILIGAKAKIVAREQKEKREIWTVEGLVQPGLKRTLFSFREGFLVQVELQYEYPERNIEWYNDRMGEIRRYFDAKFGTGKLVSRTRDNDSDVIQTLVGYQWIVGNTMLELFYFSAQRDPNVFRTITVTYKAL